MGNNITKLVSIAFIGGIIGRGLRYGLNIVISRGLGPDALGIFALGMVIMKISGVLARLGLDNAAKKYIPIYRREKNYSKVLGTVLLCIATPLFVGCIIALVLYFSQGLLERTVSIKFRPPILLFFAGIPLFATMMVGMSATQGFKETKYSVYVRDFGQSGAAIVLVALGAFILSDLRAVIFGYITSLLFGTLLAVFFLFLQDSVKLSLKPEFEVRKIFTFSIPLVAIAVVQYLISWTDILVLGIFTPPEEVGWYQAAFQTSVLLVIVLQSVNSIFPTLIADLYDSGEHKRMNQVYTVVTKWITYLTVLGYVFLTLFSEEILRMFGPTNASAVTALLILGFGQLATAVAGPAGFLLSMSEYERLELVNTVTVSILNVGLNIVLIQRFGIVGAALATGFSLGLLNVLRVLEVWHLLDAFPYSRGYWKGVLAILITIPVMFFSRGIPAPAIVKVVLTGIVSLFIFFSSMAVFGPDSSDKILLDSLK